MGRPASGCYTWLQWLQSADWEDLQIFLLKNHAWPGSNIIYMQWFSLRTSWSDRLRLGFLQPRNSGPEQLVSVGNLRLNLSHLTSTGSTLSQNQLGKHTTHIFSNSNFQRYFNPVSFNPTTNPTGNFHIFSHVVRGQFFCTPSRPCKAAFCWSSGSRSLRLK